MGRVYKFVGTKPPMLSYDWHKQGWLNYTIFIQFGTDKLSNRNNLICFITVEYFVLSFYKYLRFIY